MDIESILDVLESKMSHGYTVVETFNWARQHYGEEAFDHPGLTIRRLQEISVARSEQVFHKPGDDPWTPLEWAGSMAGEAGEAANKAKKLRRGEDIAPEEMGEEIADTFCYGVLFGDRIGIDVEDSVITKFNQVSIERGADYFL